MIRCLLLLVALMIALPARAQPAAIAFVHVNVVPMDGDHVLHDQTVLVSDGKIAAIGPGLDLPPGIRTIDGARRLWLSPGLADMHVHSDTRDDLAVYLANGITMIVNMGDARSGFVGRTAPASNAGRIPGPHVYNAFIIDGSPDYGHFTVTTPEEARAAVGLARTNGYRFIKVYNNLSAPAFAALVQEARRLGLPVVGHGVTAVGLRAQVAQGQALIAHAEEFFYTFFARPGEPQTDAAPPPGRIAEAVDFVTRSGVAVGADLVTYGTIMRQIGHPEVVEAALAAPTAAYVSPADRLGWQRGGYVAKTADLRARYAFLAAMLKAMADADVELLAGTDAPTIPGVAAGFSLHDDLALLEQAGLSRYQALASATRNAGRFVARTLGDTPFGTVTPGARADLLLTDGNPLDDLAVLRHPRGVMQGGAWYDAARLAGLLADVAKAYGPVREP